MRLSLSEEEVGAALAEGRPCLLATRLPADLETPVGAYLKLRAAFGSPSLLLESIEGGAVRGRYTMLAFRPDLLWMCHDGAVSVARDCDLPNPAFAPDHRAPLDTLRALLAESAVPNAGGLPPMAAGIFGTFAYDMVRHMERLPPPKPDRLGVPDAMLMRPTLMLVFDHVTDEITVVTPIRSREGVPASDTWRGAVERLEAAVSALLGPVPKDNPAKTAGPFPEPVSNTPEDEYLAMVARAKEYIGAGDVFQVVLSQRFSAPFGLSAFRLYRALRRVNPAPFLCYLDFGAWQVAASSPEILVRLRDGVVTIRPLAGTRPRGATEVADADLASELLTDEKERAEHLMLLDLGRNDVGRVAEIGSVAVTESFALERYSQVMHIVSNVEGRIAPGKHALDALVAGFPAGTVSGAPKIRAMEIIDELERDRRGIYAGCIGYFGADGSMDTCIALRTALVKDGIMHVQAGAGIVHDSDPAAEHAECQNKARALFRAAEEALRQASDGAGP